MKTLLILVCIPSVFACTIVEGDRILGRDFAAANALFASLDPKVEIAASPIPGVTRVFRGDEIRRVARLNTVALTPPIAEMCFERATESLTPEKLMPALREALALEDTQIEILDFSHAPVPHGMLSFSKTGLSAAGMWRGRVVYDGSRSAPIWAKVHVTVERTWIEAAEPVSSGTLLSAAQLIVRKGPRFPFGPAPIDSVDAAASRKTLRSIRAGEPIFANMLILPRDIERGDTVRVEVKSGGALLEFDGIAQSPARIGESVLIKNPETSRFFQAHVDTKGKVSVTK